MSPQRDPLNICRDFPLPAPDATPAEPRFQDPDSVTVRVEQIRAQSAERTALIQLERDRLQYRKTWLRWSIAAEVVAIGATTILALLGTAHDVFPILASLLTILGNVASGLARRRRRTRSATPELGGDRDHPRRDDDDGPDPPSFGLVTGIGVFFGLILGAIGVLGRDA